MHQRRQVSGHRRLCHTGNNSQAPNSLTQGNLGVARPNACADENRPSQSCKAAARQACPMAFACDWGGATDMSCPSPTRARVRQNLGRRPADPEHSAAHPPRAVCHQSGVPFVRGAVMLLPRWRPLSTQKAAPQSRGHTTRSKTRAKSHRVVGYGYAQGSQFCVCVYVFLRRRRWAQMPTIG